MLPPMPLLFDAHLHPRGLSDDDLATMRSFGVEAALVAADHQSGPAAPRALLEQFEDILQRQLPRLARAGIRAYAALGVHPRSLPKRGLEEVLDALPRYFVGGRVIALGEIGLHDATDAEADALSAQLALARRLKLPVMVHTPRARKEPVTRRTLALIRESGISPPSVLIDHTSARTVQLVLACGHLAGLTLHPEELSCERALALIRRLGSARIVLDSDAGDGPSDLLGLARLASRLRRSGLSERLIARVSYDNARRFLRLTSTR